VVPWIRKFPQLFVARTFSKWQACCVRLGAVIAREDSLSLVRPRDATLPVNLAALVAARCAVRDRAAMQTYVKNVKRLRTSLAMELNALA